MIAVVLFGVAFLVRAAVGALFTAPGYPDAYYYVNVARDLAAGHGLTVDYVWNFVDVGGQLPAQASLPIPADAHWMPLAQLVQVPFIWLLGPTGLASMLPFWIIGALAAPLTYAIARDARLDRLGAASAGLMVAVPGALTPYFSQPDNFGLFVTLGAGSLWLCSRGIQGDRRAFVLGGALVGLATLSRSDGILLGVPFALVGVRDVLRGARDGRRGVGWSGAIGCALAFMIVVAPWLVRQYAVFGSPLPSTDSGILWLRSYDQLFSIAAPHSFDNWLAQGLGPIIASRLGGFLAALGLFVLLPLVVVLAPFAGAGVWLRRRDLTFTPFFVYAATLFLASGLLFAVHVPHGTFIHSASALLPHTFVLVIVGIGAAVRLAARWRRSWDVRQATTVFTVGAVLVAALGGVAGTAVSVRQWESVQGAQRAATVTLAGNADGATVMSADPGAVRFLTGHGGVVTPNDDISIIEDAMRAYDVRWLLLEKAQIVPALAPVFSGAQQPSWLSGPVEVATTDTSTNQAVAPAGSPAAILYAVCLTAQDARCNR